MSAEIFHNNQILRLVFERFGYYGNSSNLVHTSSGEIRGINFSLDSLCSIYLLLLFYINLVLQDPHFHQDLLLSMTSPKEFRQEQMCGDKNNHQFRYDSLLEQQQQEDGF